MPWSGKIYYFFAAALYVIASFATAQQTEPPDRAPTTATDPETRSDAPAGKTSARSGGKLEDSRDHWQEQAPPEEATSSQRLMIIQAEELIQAGEFAEAISNLEKIVDRDGERLIEVGSLQQAGTQTVLRYVPLHQWVQKRLFMLLNANPQLRKDYQVRLAATAEAEVQRLQQSKSMVDARDAMDRLLTTQSGYRFAFMLADLYLEQGWTIAAQQALHGISDVLHPANSSPMLDGSNLPWVFLWRHVDTDAMPTKQLLEGSLAKTNIWKLTNLELAELALPRFVASLQLNQLAGDPHLWKSWLSSLLAVMEPEMQARLEPDLSDWKLVRENKRSDTWHSFAGNNTRNAKSSGPLAFDNWPTWTQTLPSYTTNSDRTPASLPRAAESSAGALPYHPVIEDGKIFLNLMTEIVAFELSNGKPWPPRQAASSLYSSGVGPVAYLPLGYPFVGTPRGTLSVDSGQLFARMGPAVTGSANDVTSDDGGSLSSIIGLDLQRQGSMLRGFPIRLMPPEFEGYEFEGPPMVWGDLVLVAVSQREHVGLRRSVVAFNRESGALVWRSGVLATGSVAGTERANLISHQVLSAAGGRVFYNTNLGSIACLDPLDGKIIWLTQYTRSRFNGKLSAPDRFRYRDLTPCLIDQGLVYCAPQDCPEIFALSATTGDLVWCTDSVQAADVVHLLGIHGDHLIASGDGLLWIDRLGGRVQSRFPGANTPGVVNALPQPRGIGRGTIAGDEILYPVADEILVFDANLDEASASHPLGAIPHLLRRHRLGARARDGGNVIVTGDHVLYVSPSRLMSFSRSQNDALSLSD